MTGSGPTFEWRYGVPVEDEEEPELQDDLSVQLEERQLDDDGNIQEEQQQGQIIEEDIEEPIEDAPEVPDNSEDELDGDEE